MIEISFQLNSLRLVLNLRWSHGGCKNWYFWLRGGGGRLATLINSDSIGFAWTHLGTLATVWTHLDSDEVTCTNMDSLGLTRIDCDSLGLTGNSLGVAWSHLGSLGLKWPHLDSHGLTWNQLDSLWTPKRLRSCCLWHFGHLADSSTEYNTASHQSRHNDLIYSRVVISSFHTHIHIHSYPTANIHTHIHIRSYPTVNINTHIHIPTYMNIKC